PHWWSSISSPIATSSASERWAIRTLSSSPNCIRKPPADFDVDPEPSVSRSSSTTSVMPSSARCHATEEPSAPPPTMTTSARSTRALCRRVDRRQRRRPRADRRNLAAPSVELPVAERVLGLHHLVDLRRALVDDRRARVAEVPLDAVLRGVAVRAEHLDREVRGLERRLGCVPLRERGLARVALPLVLHPGGLHDEQLRGLVAEDHGRDHVLHELVAADRLAERLPLARVLDGSFQARTDHSARAGGDREAALVERVHRDLEALPLGADH